MSTPGFDKNFARYVTNSYTIINRYTGAYMGGGNLVDTAWVLRDVRPASQTNVKRSDGTRANGPWYRFYSRYTPMSGVFSDYSGMEGDITTRGPLVWNYQQLTPDESRVAGQMKNARLKALSKATATSAQANAALRQARDLARMSGDYVTRAANGLDKLFRSKPGWYPDFVKNSWDMAKGGWKKIPDDYLAYLYGVAPLGDDIANCLDELSTMRDYGLGMSMILRAQKQVRTSRPHYFSVRHGTGLRNAKSEATTVTTCRVGYRFDLPAWFMDNVPTVAPFSSQYQVSPWTFVLDWFLPVGDYIGALESAQFSPYFKEGFEVSYVRESLDYSNSEVTNGVYPRLRLKGRAEAGVVRRTVINEYPSSIMTRPALNPLPGVDKISQGLSLLTQLFKRWR